MSELINPLYENEREFLERQKNEYKNALMGDVDHLKTQGQDIGKKVAMAGGVLVAGLLLKRMFSGGDKKKDKKEKRVKKAKKTEYHSIPVTAEMADYDSYVHEQEDDYTFSSERMPHAKHESKTKKEVKSFLKSDFTKMISSQLMTLLLMYVSKKVEEHLNTVSENNDIAAAPVQVDIVETEEYIVPKEDAI